MPSSCIFRLNGPVSRCLVSYTLSLTVRDSEARPRLRNMHLGRLRCLSCIARGLEVQRTCNRALRFHLPIDRQVMGLRALQTSAGPYDRTGCGAQTRSGTLSPRFLRTFVAKEASFVASFVPGDR